MPARLEKASCFFDCGTFCCFQLSGRTAGTLTELVSSLVKSGNFVLFAAAGFSGWLPVQP
jgi:hypothetical protein